MKNIKAWFSIAAVSTLIALAAHGYLSLQSYRLKSGMGDGKSVCNINSQFNCDAVALSDYSQFLGIPIALWAFATNVLFLLVLTLGFLGWTQNRARVLKVSLFLGGLILAASLIMGAISFTQLGTYCLFCMLTYLMSIFQFIGAYKLQEQKFFAGLGEDILGVLKEQRWIAVLFLCIPAGTYLGHSMASDAYGLKMATRFVGESLEFWKRAPKFDFKEDQGLVYQVGKSEPKMVIVEFADFLCPHCKSASAPLHAFTESHPDVKLIFKAFPLDGTCNGMISQKGDGLRCELAAATYCAEKIAQKGWAASDWIFAHQSNFFGGPYWQGAFNEFATAVGIEASKMRECIDSAETKDVVFKTAEEGGKANIPGTPTIFVNGKKLDRGQAIPVLDAVYRSL